MIKRCLKVIRNIPLLLMGYNVYVNIDKTRLLSHTLKNVIRNASASADLGGAWKVNGAYTHYLATQLGVRTATIIDTNFNEAVLKKLQRHRNIHIVQGDFGSKEVIEKMTPVDVVLLFDVLLHQVKPDWNDILEMYAPLTKCFVIYNQQLTTGDETIRLTHLPLKEYTSLVPHRRDDFYEFVYEHAQEECAEYQKKWIDVHNLWQWGITDASMRRQCEKLGFSEVFYRNYGRFSNLNAFENHGFVFVKK